MITFSCQKDVMIFLAEELKFIACNHHIFYTMVAKRNLYTAKTTRNMIWKKDGISRGNKRNRILNKKPSLTNTLSTAYDTFIL